MKASESNQFPITLLATFLALFAALVWVDGYSDVDYRDFVYMTTHLLVTQPDISRQFLYDSPLIYFIGQPLSARLNVDDAYWLVNILGVLAFFTSSQIYFAHRYRERSALALVLLAASPLLYILLSWGGKSDSYLVAAFFALYWLRRPLAIAVAALLIVLSHRQMGTLMLIAYLFLSTPKSRLRIVALTAGLLLGNLLIFLYQNVLLSTPPHGRLVFVAGHIHDATKCFLQHPIIAVLCSMGGFWFYVVRARGLRLRELAVWVGALGVSAFCVDTTRVAVILSLPVVLSVIDRVLDPVSRDLKTYFWLWAPAILLCLIHYQIG